MDLHDFSGGEMYFNESLSEPVKMLIQYAADHYGSDGAEQPLMIARAYAPDSLTVLVALYRFFYYQHRYADALGVAHRCLEVVSDKLQFSRPWQEMNMNCLGLGILTSMTLVRFYLLSLKGAGYLNLRLNKLDEGIAMLQKVAELDTQDRLGSRVLLEVAEGYQRRANANFGKLTLVASQDS